MKDCSTFRDRLLDGVPYPYHYSHKHTLRAIDCCAAALDFFSDALEASVRHVDCDVDPIVIATGSFGRLDGCTAISDFDAIYLYKGRTSKARRENLEEFVCKLAECNVGLRFDHRASLENRDFDFRASPAYPVLSTSEVRSARSERTAIRALQILTEGRAVRNPAAVYEVRRHLLTKKFGYADNAAQLDLTPLRQQLAGFRDSYCRGAVSHKKGGWQLTNAKILKLFTLREFSYLANLFAMAEVALGVVAGGYTVDKAILVLSSPSILKFASFASPRGVFDDITRHTSPQVKDKLIRALSKEYRSLPPEKRDVMDEAIADVRDGELYAYLRGFVLPVLRKHETLLSQLHDGNMLRHLDSLDGNVFHWMAIQPYRTILAKRDQMVGTICDFAKALLSLLTVLDSYDLHAEQARIALQEAAAYQLQLTRTAI